MHVRIRTEPEARQRLADCEALLRSGFNGRKGALRKFFQQVIVMGTEQQWHLRKRNNRAWKKQREAPLAWDSQEDAEAYLWDALEAYADGEGDIVMSNPVMPDIVTFTPDDLELLFWDDAGISRETARAMTDAREDHRHLHAWLQDLEADPHGLFLDIRTTFGIMREGETQYVRVSKGRVMTDDRSKVDLRDLVTLEEAEAAMGLGSGTLRGVRWRHEGFPEHVRQFGRVKVWSLAAIVAWNTERLAAWEASKTGRES